MCFFSFLKYTFITFATQLATSCGAPFQNHCYIGCEMSYELGMIWKNVAVACSRYYRGFCLERLRKATKTSVRISGVIITAVIIESGM
jgi:hypothetical protein